MERFKIFILVLSIVSLSVFLDGCDKDEPLDEVIIPPLEEINPDNEKPDPEKPDPEPEKPDPDPEPEKPGSRSWTGEAWSRSWTGDSARMGRKSGMDTWSHRYAGSTNVGVCVLNTKQGGGWNGIKHTVGLIVIKKMYGESNPIVIITFVGLLLYPISFIGGWNKTRNM